MVRCAVPRMDLEHLRVTPTWLLGLRHPSLTLTFKQPSTQKFRNHTQVFNSIMWLQTCLTCYWDICILNSVSHNITVWACWVNWVYLMWVTAPRCTFSQVSLPTCATCSLTGGWKWDSWRDWSWNIDSGCWGHLGQFISAKQIIRLPRGKPKTQRWEGMDQIYPCQLKLPH